MATSPQHPARRRLAERLRAFREEAGVSGAEFAARAGWTQSKVSKLETGRQLPTAEDAAIWITATFEASPEPMADRTSIDIPARVDELLVLLENARQEYQALQALYASTGGAAGLQDQVAAWEAGATRLLRYQPAMVVGLLQTPEYAREILRMASRYGEPVPDEQVDRAVAGRLRRQAIVHEPGRDITLLMGEAALWVRATSLATHLAQLERIASDAVSTRARVGVVPFSEQVPTVSTSGFTIYDEVVVVEALTGDLEIGDPVEVEKYSRVAYALLEVAVTGSAAAAYVRDVAARQAAGKGPGPDPGDSREA